MKQTLIVRKIILDDLMEMLATLKKEEHPTFVDVILITDEIQDSLGVMMSQEYSSLLPGKLTDQDINQLI